MDSGNDDVAARGERAAWSWRPDGDQDCEEDAPEPDMAIEEAAPEEEGYGYGV